MIARLIAWLKNNWGRRPPRAAPRKQENAVPKQQNKPADFRKEMGETGAWDSLPALLDALPPKFERLRETKFHRYRGMCDVAQLVKHVGCFLPGRFSSASTERLINSARPGFLLVSIEDYYINDPAGPELCAFSDWVFFTHLPRDRVDFSKVQNYPKSWTLYEAGLGASKGKEHPSFWLPWAFIGVTPSGEVRAIKLKQTHHHTSPRNYRKQWATTQWVDSANFMGTTPEKARESFCWLMNLALMRDAHWSVTVTSPDGYKISFSVPDNEAKYFFRHRKKNGKKIFHAVAAHHRRLPTGKTTTVKTHYRGNRHFKWEDYDVSVQLPGLHRGTLFDNPKLLADTPENHAKYGDLISVSDAAPRIGEALDY